MEDGNAPLDNSDAEMSIRDFAVFKALTTSGFDSVEGVESAVVFSSFHETCKNTECIWVNTLHTCSGISECTEKN